MKMLQVSLLALLLSDCNAAWTPSLHRVNPVRSAPSTTTSSASVGPLHMSPSNSTNSKERQEQRTHVDMDSNKFMSGMDRELEALKKQNNTTMDAYSKALQQNLESNPASPPTSDGRVASSTRGKGFGKSPANEAKKKSFMEKNRRSTKETEDKSQPQDMIADQIVNQLETASPPTPPTSQQKKTPRDLIQEAKRARASQESAKQEKTTYFPPKPDPVTEKKKKQTDPVAEKKEDTTSTAAEKKTYFPPSPMKKDTVVPPPPPKAKEETTKSYFPPTPMAKKPPVVQKEEPPKPKEKSIPKVSDPVVKPVAEEKPASMETKKQEETPAPLVKPKKEQIFKKKELKPDPIAKKGESVAKKEEPVANVESMTKPKVTPTPPKTAAPVQEIPKPVSDPVSKVGSSVPLDTGIAASKVTEKIQMDTTTTTTTTPSPTKKKSKKKFEMPRMDLPKIELPKINLPKADFDPAAMAKKFEFKIDQNTVDQAKEFAKNAGTTMADAAQVVAKDGKTWVLRVQGSLNTTKVEDLDITYEEAFQKVARSGRGFLKICSLVGNAVKDTTMIFAKEIQKGSGKTKTTSAPKRIISPAASTSSNKMQSSTMSFLEGLGKTPTLGDVEEENKVQEAPVVKKNRINFRDIVLPKPELNDVEPEEDAFETADEFNEIKTQASSVFGSFWSSASSLVDTVKSKAMEESEKMRAASKKNASNMSKSKPIDGLKRKKGLFFLDAEDE